MKKYESVSAYLKDQPKDLQPRLKEVISAVRAVLPNATEAISYGMPVWKEQGVVLYVGGWKKHIGIYPITAGVKNKFKKELASYEMSTGTVRFPHDEKLPIPLIKKIARERLRENKART